MYCNREVLPCMVKLLVRFCVKEVLRNIQIGYLANSFVMFVNSTNKYLQCSKRPAPLKCQITFFGSKRTTRTLDEFPRYNNVYDTCD